MAETPNYGLHVVSPSDNETNVIDWVQKIDGTASTSNTMRMDAWMKNTEDSINNHKTDENAHADRGWLSATDKELVDRPRIDADTLDGQTLDQIKASITLSGLTEDDKGVPGGVASLDDNGQVPADQLPAMDYVKSSEKGVASGVATLGADGKIPTGQIPSLSYIATAEKGMSGGVSTLDSSGKVPVEQLPEMDFIQNAEKGVAGGVATLGDDGKINSAQLPDLDYIPASEKGSPGGVATLADNGKISIGQIPDLSYIPSTSLGNANGVATLGSDGKVPSGQLPSLDYVPNSDKGIAGGVASLDDAGKVPADQLPSMDYVQSSEKGTASGVATLGEDGVLAESQRPTVSGIKSDDGEKTLAQLLSDTVESTDYPGCYYRMVDGVVEWLNAPMVNGIEYRTTERYLGKPVYKRMIDFGALPSSGSKEVSVPDADDVMRNISIDLSKSVCTKTGSLHTNLFPSHPSISGFYFNAGTVRIETTNDYSSWSAQICISYTKSTD